jgi:RNA polymerase-interacting CarD/CdnL/TRCF family regulator
VRDLVGYARQFDLTAGDKKWLARACERLSAEAARVDAIEPDAARAAITTEVERLKAR